MITDFKELMDFSNNNIYFMMLLARPKNNKEITKVSRIFIREPVRKIEDYEFKLEKLRYEAKRFGYRFYIYISVNARSVINGYENFKKITTAYECDALHGKEDFHEPLMRLDKLWYSCMMKPNARATKYFLVDIDTKSLTTLQTVRDTIYDWESHGNTSEILFEQETRNGWHYICKPFDVRIFQSIRDVEVKTDGLLFLESIGFDEE